MQSELDKNKKMQDLIYFQNLVPGAQNSPFIARFKKECLDDDDKDEEYEARQSLLNKFPPVLSFFEDQKKKFYEDEAKNCQQFCCGNVQVSFDASGVTSFKQQDQYMLSTGTGKLYEGSAGQIKKEIQNDIHKESFASPEQKQGIAGLKNFDAIVAERGQNNKSAADSIQLTPPSSLSPFKTAPKPE